MCKHSDQKNTLKQGYHQSRPCTAVESPRAMGFSQHHPCDQCSELSAYRCCSRRRSASRDLPQPDTTLTSRFNRLDQNSGTGTLWLTCLKPCRWWRIGLQTSFFSIFSSVLCCRLHLTSALDLYPAVHISFSRSLFQIGRSLPLRPCGVHWSACLAVLSSHLLTVFPIQVHFLRRIWFGTLAPVQLILHNSLCGQCNIHNSRQTPVVVQDIMSHKNIRKRSTFHAAVRASF